MAANSMGPNAVWLLEFLTEAMALEPGMRVLDLGCGRAMTSIFLAREFDVEVWATDLWVSAEENATRVVDADLEGRVHPVHAEAHTLPFEANQFDAVISVDAYHYFGTNDLYVGYLLDFVRVGGQLAMTSPGLVAEFEDDPPTHLHSGWHWDFASFHSASWWQRHWARTGLVDVVCADWLEDGWRYWAAWNRVCSEARDSLDHSEAEMVENDAGRNLGFVRLLANKRAKGRWS